MTAFRKAVVIGASGGIGGALAAALREEDVEVVDFARSWSDERHIDVTVEETIAAAALTAARGGAPDLVLVATGILHDDGVGPEKSLGQIDADWMATNFAVNATGPALVAKHFLPIMPKTGRTIFATLSARIGSISENRLGGWYAYRASKAALNQLVRTLSIEEKRRNDRSIVVALHPGTVDTDLSKPFQGNVQPGRLFACDRAAVQLLDVLEGLKAPDSGRLFDWEGKEVSP